MSTKRLPLYRDKQALWDLLLDGLSAWLLSVGVTLAFDQLFRFHATFAAILLHPLLVVGVLLLFQRKLWLLPILVAAGLSLTAAILSAAGTLGETMDFLVGFFRWWVSLFPSRSPYNTAENIQLVQWLLHIAIAVVIYVCVRLTHSAAFLGTAATIFIFIVSANNFHQNIPAMAWMAAGLFPLMARSFYPRRPHARLVALTPLRGARLSAVAVCAAAGLLVALILPTDTSAWKWRPLAERAADIGSFLQLEGSQGRRTISLRSLGLQPRVDRLGGDIEQDNYTPILLVEAPAATLMKGRVYDVYTGTGWEIEEDMEYRFGSSAFDTEYRRTFGIGKPDSADGMAYWQAAMTNADVQVTLLQGGSTLYQFGRVQSLSLLDSRNQPPMFNTRSETFVRTNLKRQNRYTFQTQWLNRNRSGFSLAFSQLEQAAALTTDLDYASIQHHYTQLPDPLSNYVQNLARVVTAEYDSPYDKMAALERYLRTNYTYTLTPGDVPRDSDFVEYFLESGEGYCVYFASAMTVMARTLDIPARFVVGYGLERNGDGRFIALQKNAHAWVECYFYGIGWVTFDPTASSDYMTGAAASVNPNPGDDPSGDGSDVPGQTTEVTEVTEVPDPATTDPTETPTEVSHSGTTSGYGMPAPRDPPTWLWIVLPLGLLLAALVWLLCRIQTFRTAYRLETVRSRRPQLEDQAAWYYADMLRQLAHLGYVPAAGETLLQFSRRIVEGGNVQPELTGVFDRIMDWRYGEIPLTPQHVEQMAQAHDALEDWLRSQMNRWSYFWKRIIGHG